MSTENQPPDAAEKPPREFWIVKHVNYGYSVHESKPTAERIKGNYADWEIIHVREVTPNLHWVSRGTFNQVAAERDDLAKQLADSRAERDS